MNILKAGLQHAEVETSSRTNCDIYKLAIFKGNTPYIKINFSSSTDVNHLTVGHAPRKPRIMASAAGYVVVKQAVSASLASKLADEFRHHIADEQPTAQRDKYNEYKVPQTGFEIKDEFLRVTPLTLFPSAS